MARTFSLFFIGDDYGRKRQRYLSRHSKGFLSGFILLLFLLASCSSGGGSGDGQGIFSVELAFTPGDEQVTVHLVEQPVFVRVLNISAYELTTMDSATNGTNKENIAAGSLNGTTVGGLTNGHNYTFALRAFYFPVGSAELSNFSLRIDYADGNAENIRAAGGITIGLNRDGDSLADLVDLDDDNDGLNDVNATGGEELDRCPRGDIGWRSNEMTDNDGDGCRDAGEDRDDDNDNVTDDADLGEYEGRECRLFVDCDNDTVSDSEDLGEFGGTSCRIKPDCDDDSVLDAEDNCPAVVSSSQADGDGDGAGDACDLDDDGDGLIEIGTAAELNAVRWVLDGSGRRLSEGAALDQTGCGDGVDRTVCRGYELTRDISLAGYTSGSGWAPLGQDTDSGTTGCQGTAFSGIFDGNGFTVGELNITRSEEDCIGLFGHLAVGTVIRNLTVEAGKVIGRTNVGTLVGSGANVTIVSSSSVATQVNGSIGAGGGLIGSIGGLIGSGGNAKIVSSYSVTAEVIGIGGSVGGLVGSGIDVKVVSSFSVTGRVTSEGALSVGGLVGSGASAEIVSSSSVTGEVSSGGNAVGGLIGSGSNAKIVSSYSVADEVSGNSAVGGLMGFDNNVEIVSSYSVAGEIETMSATATSGGLVGEATTDGEEVDYSYWNTTVLLGGNDKGENKTLGELRMPTNANAYDASSIYANWTRGADIDDMAGVEDITVYCDEDISDTVEPDEKRDDNRIWDFGGEEDYPAIRCLPLSLAEQRSWWSISTATDRPQLNRTRLNALTAP